MFSVPQCEYLGMIVNVNKGIFIPCFHVDSLLKIPVSTNGKTLKKVLATFNFFAFHMLGYKQAVKALYKFQSVKGDISNIIGLPYSHLKKVIADAITLEPIRSSCNGLDIFLSASSMSFSFILTARYREGRRIFDVEGRMFRNTEINYNFLTKIMLAAKEAVYSNQVICSAFKITIHSRIKQMPK